MYFVHTQKGPQSKNRNGTGRNSKNRILKATKGNGIGMEGNRRNQRRIRKRTESDQIRNCKGRLMYRKLTKKNRKEKKGTEKSKRK
jgi:hypothetical protein